MTTNDQASFLNEQDCARIWRVLSGTRYAGNLNIWRKSTYKSVTVEDVIEALEQLRAQLLDVSEAAYANEVKLREHAAIFGALGKLAALAGLTREEAASLTQKGTGQ